MTSKFGLYFAMAEKGKADLEKVLGRKIELTEDMDDVFAEAVEKMKNER